MKMIFRYSTITHKHLFYGKIVVFNAVLPIYTWFVAITAQIIKHSLGCNKNFFTNAAYRINPNVCNPGSIYVSAYQIPVTRLQSGFLLRVRDKLLFDVECSKCSICICAVCPVRP